MPWVRLDEKAMDHPKVERLSDGAFRLWIQVLTYCQRHLTDGAVTNSALRKQLSYSPKRKADLIASGLWDAAEGGIKVHDYLQWNASREQVLWAREMGQRRAALFRDPDLREAIRARDGDNCRYCGVRVVWKDRKGPHGGTYDHVDPFVGNTMTNLVVCCRFCNTSKGRRTPEESGKTLRPPPANPVIGSLKRDLDPDLDANLEHIYTPPSGVLCSDVRSSKDGEGGPGETKPHKVAFDGSRLRVWRWQHEDLARRLGEKAFDLLAWYPTLNAELERTGESYADPWKWLQERFYRDAGLPVPNLFGKPQKPRVERLNEHGEDWFDECQRLHRGVCGGRSAHLTSMKHGLLPSQQRALEAQRQS